jgi:hypothetical protein
LVKRDVAISQSLFNLSRTLIRVSGSLKGECGFFLRLTQQYVVECLESAVGPRNISFCDAFSGNLKQ